MTTGDSGRIIVKRGNAREIIRDRRLFRAIRRASALNRRVRALEPELSEARTLIAKRAKDFSSRGKVSFEAGGARLSVTSRYEAMIPEGRVDEARRLLGRRFNELVRVKTTYHAAMFFAEDTRSGRDPALREAGKLIVLRETAPRFSWE